MSEIQKEIDGIDGIFRYNINVPIEHDLTDEVSQAAMEQVITDAIKVVIIVAMVLLRV